MFSGQSATVICSPKTNLCFVWQDVQMSKILMNNKMCPKIFSSLRGSDHFVLRDIYATFIEFPMNSYKVDIFTPFSLLYKPYTTLQNLPTLSSDIIHLQSLQK